MVVSRMDGLILIRKTEQENISNFAVNTTAGYGLAALGQGIWSNSDG